MDLEASSYYEDLKCLVLNKSFILSTFGFIVHFWIHSPLLHILSFGFISQFAENTDAAHQILLNHHVIVEAAFCYEHAQDFCTALQYYTLALEHDTLLPPSGRSECLHHMGAIYFNHVHDYANSLRMFFSSRTICQQPIKVLAASI